MCYNRNMDLYIIILIIRTSFMPDWSSIATIFQSSWAFLTPVYACLRRISENVLKYGLKGPIEQINKSNTSKWGPSGSEVAMLGDMTYRPHTIEVVLSSDRFMHAGCLYVCVGFQQPAESLEFPHSVYRIE